MIVHMLSDELNEYQKEWPEGAYCLTDHTYGRKSDGSLHVITLYESHHGKCLFEKERNMHDDSDFFMTVWENGAPREILFATTRGWSYPCYASHPDATPEVQAEYAAWKAAKERRERIQYRWNARLEEIALAHELGISRDTVRKLQAAYQADQIAFDRVTHLLKSKKLKSNFKLSLREQVVSWLNDPKPKYGQPLSSRQIACLGNTYGRRY